MTMKKQQQRRDIARLLWTVDADCKILGQEAGLHGLNADTLQSVAKSSQIGIAVQLGTMSQTTSPGKDWRNRVGAVCVCFCLRTSTNKYDSAVVLSLAVDNHTWSRYPSDVHGNDGWRYRVQLRLR
jgi:hypothetical protein